MVPLGVTVPVSAEEHMYLKVNKFLLSHENLNMNKVPGFYQFFYSSDFEVTCLRSSGSESLPGGGPSHCAAAPWRPGRMARGQQGAGARTWKCCPSPEPILLGSPEASCHGILVVCSG